MTLFQQCLSGSFLFRHSNLLYRNLVNRVLFTFGEYHLHPSFSVLLVCKFIKALKIETKKKSKMFFELINKM